jgi:ribonuclease P protein component
MRFRAESHLRRPVDFSTVRNQGRRYHCGGFVLWAFRQARDAEVSVPLPELPARAGFVASRSAVGNAVARNLAKRRMREIFRHHQERVPAGMDLVFVARRSLNGLEYAEIERKFVTACVELFSKSSR